MCSGRQASQPELEAVLAREKLYTELKRDLAILLAHLKRGYTLSDGGHLVLHYTTVSKVVNQAENGK